MGSLFFGRLDAIWIFAGTIPEAAMDKLVGMAVQGSGQNITIFYGYHGDRSPVISVARWLESTHSQILGLSLPESDVTSGEDGEVYALHLMGPAPDGQALDPDGAGNYPDTGQRVGLNDVMRPYLSVETVPES